MGRFSKWSPERKAAQCIFPRLDIDMYFDDNDYKIHIGELARIGVGGFCIFHGDIAKTERAINELQNLADTPLLFAADFENGLPMRLEEGAHFPHAMALGRLETASTEEMASMIAAESKAIGVDWNFAPVADINSNKDNPIINIRSFGETEKNVSDRVAAYVRGANSKKIISCAKHFPGHGDTNVDSHLDLPILDFDMERLRTFEFKPFISAIEAGVDSIMTAHLAVSAFGGETPASLSPLTYKTLRDELGFKGVIVTDALDMHSITNRYDSTETSLIALKAGATIALMSPDPIGSIRLTAQEIENNPEFSNLIEHKLELIYSKKRKCGLIPRFARNKSSEKLFLSHHKAALKMAYRAMKIDDPERLIPLSEKKVFAVYAFTTKDADIQKASRFFTMLAQATENDCDFAFIDPNISEDQINSYNENTLDAEIIIFVTFLRSEAFLGSVAMPEKFDEIFKKLSGNKKTIMISAGNPYILEKISSNAYICSFSDAFSSLAALVVALSGREESLDY